MQQFLKLIEIAKTKGIASTVAGENVKVGAPGDKFWNLIEQAQPFVFSPWTKAIQNVNWEQLPDHGAVKIEDLDAPFKVFSIESIEDKGLINIAPTIDEKGYKMLCILVVELSPKEFGFYTLIDLEDRGLVIYKSNSEGDIVKAYINRINTEATGLEQSRTAVKIGTGDSKRIHRIRKIIHVSPKKQRENYSSETSRTINWTHRFLVRGHWRNLPNKLGKDREGNYAVTGFTWVTEHERGPENMPLITKTRMVTK